MSFTAKKKMRESDTLRVKIRNRYDDKHSINVYLPAEPMELYDMLDMIGSDNK